MKKTFLNWSSGKDSALALYKIQQENQYSVEKLITTVNAENDRISMHFLPLDLLKKQASQLEIPLQIIQLKGNIPMQEYSEIMKNEISELAKHGFKYSIYGDILLEDLREFRDNQLKSSGITSVYPLWKKDTKKLISEFLEVGFKAIAICTNTELLDKSFCGREIDASFIEDLPENVDPCGENGEFHTFVYDGPIFKKPIKFKKGKIIEKNYKNGEDKDWPSRFYYRDLISE